MTRTRLDCLQLYERYSPANLGPRLRKDMVLYAAFRSIDTPACQRAADSLDEEIDRMCRFWEGYPGYVKPKSFSERLRGLWR